MTFSVITAPEADADIRAIDAWWRANRDAAPLLFFEELADALSLLAVYPEIGRRHEHRRLSDLRRLLLRATRYHVYYIFTGDTVTILSVWSSVRRRGPKLGI
jgi:plasmid stabilization system protein ParE